LSWGQKENGKGKSGPEAKDIRTRFKTSRMDTIPAKDGKDLEKKGRAALFKMSFQGERLEERRLAHLRTGIGLFAEKTVSKGGEYWDESKKRGKSNVDG